MILHPSLFVKLSKETQNEVSLLAKMGAFKVGKTVDKKEISLFLKLYEDLPVTVHNKKQNVIKKRWLQGYNSLR